MLFENEQLKVVCPFDFQGGTSFVDHFCYLCLVFIVSLSVNFNNDNSLATEEVSRPN